MKYFDKRQNTLRFPEEEIEDVFRCIADHFTLKWLSSKNTHSLQLLWNRQDVLATNELYSFGRYLKTLCEIDPKWTKQRVKDIKADNRNQQKGAFFEICALGMLANSSQKVLPSKGNMPGYDGTLFLSSGKKMNISIKNYNLSSHYREFLNKCAEKEKEFVQMLKQNGISDAQLVLDSDVRFPQKESWDRLTEGLEVTTAHFKKNIIHGAFNIIPDHWGGVITEIEDSPGHELHSGYQSYSFIAFSIFHPNEENNLFDKLDDACCNLAKHCQETENEINVAFIRIPENISIIACESFVRNYFDRFPDKPVTGVLLYQPSVATDLSNGDNFISHVFRLVLRESKFAEWNSEMESINFQVAVGRISNNPTSLKLLVGDGDERKEFDYSHKYHYQRGNHYLKQIEAADGSKWSNINTLGSGIFRHAVMQFAPGQPEFILSGKFAPEDRLLIL